MKIILTKDQDLGEEGQVIVVAEGFGRNYLMPQKLAVEATPAVLKSWTGRLKAIKRHRAKEKDAWKKIAEQFAGRSIELTATASSKGKLFGAVTAGKIVQALQEQLGLAVDKKIVHLTEPIKEVGEFKFSLKWAPEAVAEVNLKVSARPADAE